MIIYIRGAYAVTRIKIAAGLPTILLRAWRVRSPWLYSPRAGPWTCRLRLLPVLCRGCHRLCCHPELFVHLPPSLWALVLEAGGESRWTTGFLCPSRAAGQACRESALLPPSGGGSLTHLALGKAFVGKTGCVPLGCSSPLQFYSMWRCSMPSSDSSSSREVMPFLLFIVLIPNEVYQHPQVLWEPLNFQDKSSEGSLDECESFCLSLLPSQIHPMWSCWGLGFLAPWWKLPLQGTLTVFPMLPSFEYWTSLTCHCFTYLCHGADTLVPVCHSAVLLLRGSFRH